MVKVQQMAKTKGDASITSAGAISKPAKKRPWRDKLRKKARKEAEKAERARLREEKEKVQLPTEESSVKKKKKRKRKKKYVEGAEEPEKEPAAKATPTQQGLEKLEAGRFRYSIGCQRGRFLVQKQLPKPASNTGEPVSTTRVDISSVQLLQPELCVRFYLFD